MGDLGSTGPLESVRVLEFAGIGPAPFAGCMLADMGADVVLVDRPGRRSPFAADILARGKRSIVLDLKKPEGRDAALRLAGTADATLEGLRPGVMERLGLGPEECLAANPSLVYGRMTGFGQDGPLAQTAGHDINYISLSGALGMIGRAGAPPTPPLNLVGDYGGGGMLLAFGVTCALLQAKASGLGQVVDAAMLDGSALLMLPFFGGGVFGGQRRGKGLLDSGAPFYDAYETSDGRWLSVGAMEPQFYSALLFGMELDPATLPAQMDVGSWPELKVRFAQVFRTKTRDEWCAIFEGTDACVAPVLDLSEVPHHPHNVARHGYMDLDGRLQPAPAPRFGADPLPVRRPSPALGEHTDEILIDWLGMDSHAVSAMRQSGAAL